MISKRELAEAVLTALVFSGFMIAVLIGLDWLLYRLSTWVGTGWIIAAGLGVWVGAALGLAALKRGDR